MSLDQSTQSAQQSAPPEQQSQAASPPSDQSQPANGSSQPSTPGLGATASGTTAQPAAAGGEQPNRGIGDNGGPDWRAMLAGEDAKALERFARYKTPADVGKALIEAQTKLSQRPEMPKLADNATPEQISEYRKSMGVPTEGTLEAYGVKAPDGYKMSDAEKGVLGDFAKLMHAKHVPAPIVKEATDYFFRQQSATEQALARQDIDKQKEWQGVLQDKLGREFEPMIAAGEAFLNQHFSDNPDAKNELLNARLPGGGRLGDNPAFIEMIIDLGMKNGFTDRIEANSLESGGKSLEAQQNELEALRNTDRTRYNLPETQAKLDKIIGLRLSRGEIDELGNPVRKRRSA